MINVQLEAWAAMAPGLDTQEAWQQWLQHPVEIPEALGSFSLASIPPMIRRRFSPLGKCAMGAILQLPQSDTPLPAIFASRHGDTALTLSLLEEMGKGEAMSPTGFSLAVHNAVSGLYSIAKKDTSAITAIAAMEGLILQTFFEAAGQLQEHEKVLCVIYDVPLPELYQRYTADYRFPYAVAMILSRAGETSLCIEPLECPDNPSVHAPQPEDESALACLNAEPIQLISLLAGQSSCINTRMNGAYWRITKTDPE